MKTLQDIREGFFGNINNEPRPEDWFNIITCYFEQYLTQWDNKKIKKDSKNFTITFPNNYKRNNKEKEVILDLSPYMEKLVEYDPNHILIKFHTGLFTNLQKDVIINNKEKKERDDEKGTVWWDKLIRIQIVYTKGVNPHPEKDIINGREVNQMIEYERRNAYMTSQAAHYKKQQEKNILLLDLAQYTEDWPFKKDGWTVIYDKLS